MGMTRAMTSIPDEWDALLAAAAKSEGRSESNYICRLIGADLRAKGLLTAQAEAPEDFLTAVMTAVREDPKLKAKIEAMISRTLRGKEAA